jgi:FolB domain-containing protein
MDKIILEQIEFQCILGVYEHEKEKAQKVYASLCGTTDFSVIQNTDKMEDGIDYTAIVYEIRKFADSHPANTMEYLAHHLCLHIKDHFGFSALELTLDKPGYCETLKIGSVKVHVCR